MSEGPRRLAWLAALLSLTPNPVGALPWLTYYFRDFTLTYYPLRDFLVAELREWRWPFWNPYLHEGVAVLPMFYPLELLQALLPGPAFASWLLTLHFPIAAIGAYALARDLGACRYGALAAGCVYAMGGLALSSLSLHWFLQALALVPLVALGMRRAARDGGRSVVVAAGLVALGISTLAVEFVVQGVLLGALLALVPEPSWRASGRAALAGALGIGLAGLPVALVLGIASESLRGAGFAASAPQSGHPVTFLQVLLPDLYGSISEPLRFWWGGRLFPEGNPYFLSLYLGPLAIALAAAGAWAGSRERVALLALGGLGLWYALGSAGGLSPLVSGVLPWFRYPVKAFLLSHAAVALLAGLGLTRLRRGEGSRALLVALAVLGAALAAIGAAAAWLAPSLAAWLDVSPRSAEAMRRTLTRESALAAGLLVAAAGMTLAARRGALAWTSVGTALAALLAADLWQAGRGVNPMASPSFFEPPAGLAPHLARPGEGRLFSFGAHSVPALQPLLTARAPGLERQAFRLSRVALTPFTNLLDRAPVAEGPDRLSFIPHPPLLADAERHPALLDRILPRLRGVGVSRVLSLDPIDHPQLSPRAELPAGAEGATLHVYDLRDPWPIVYVACRAILAANAGRAAGAALESGFRPGRDVVLELRAPEPDCASGQATELRRGTDEVAFAAQSDGTAYLVLREAHAPSWRASLDGRPVPILRANGRHRAVLMPAGRHEVRFWYEPPGLLWGAMLTTAALALAAGLWARPLRA